MKKSVLDIKIDDIDINQSVEIVKTWLKGIDKHYIVTPNPEIVLKAQEDFELKTILNNADLSVPDGVGLKLTTDIVCNTPGVDLMEELIKLSSDYGFTVGLLGGKKGIAEKTRDCLQKKYPTLKIIYVNSGGPINNEGEIIGNKLQIAKVDILFVAFGPPKQEKWVYKNLNKIPVKVAMVVGGSFDYLSNKVVRAPIWIRKLGLEWLFRLFTQPWRLKRQLKLLKYLYLLASR